jgi:hypothetical protein
MPIKPSHKGSVLTVKNLPSPAYKVIHSLPRGYRQDALKGLLTATAKLAEDKPEWYKAAVNGKLKVSVGR